MTPLKVLDGLDCPVQTPVHETDQSRVLRSQERPSLNIIVSQARRPTCCSLFFFHGQNCVSHFHDAFSVSLTLQDLRCVFRGNHQVAAGPAGRAGATQFWSETMQREKPEGKQCGGGDHQKGFFADQFGAPVGCPI